MKEGEEKTNDKAGQRKKGEEEKKANENLGVKMTINGKQRRVKEGRKQGQEG